MSPFALIAIGTGILLLARRGKTTSATARRKALKPKPGPTPSRPEVPVTCDLQDVLSNEFMQVHVAPLYAELVASGVTDPQDLSADISSVIVGDLECSTEDVEAIVSIIEEKITDLDPSMAMHGGGPVNPFDVVGEPVMFIDVTEVVETDRGPVSVIERMGSVALQEEPRAPFFGFAMGGYAIVQTNGTIILGTRMLEEPIGPFPIRDGFPKSTSAERAHQAAQEAIVPLVRSMDVDQLLIDNGFIPIGTDPLDGIPVPDPSIDDVPLQSGGAPTSGISPEEAAARAAAGASAGRAAAEAARSAAQRGAEERRRQAIQQSQAAAGLGAATRAAYEAQAQRQRELDERLARELEEYQGDWVAQANQQAAEKAARGARFQPSRARRPSAGTTSSGLRRPGGETSRRVDAQGKPSKRGPVDVQSGSSYGPQPADLRHGSLFG